ncbi:hypothetical protein pipiens_000691, partial [Culex pipiens pipiens]
MCESNQYYDILQLVAEILIQIQFLSFPGQLQQKTGQPPGRPRVSGPAYAAQFVNAKTKKSVCPETSQTAVVPCGRPSPRTVLYGETVEEIQVKDNRETRVERFLHHRSNHPRRRRRPHLPAGQAQRTLHQVRKHAEPATVPPQPNPVRPVPVRAKQLYALAEMKHFLPNVTVYTLESSTKDTDKPIFGPKWHDLSERRVS